MTTKVCRQCSTMSETEKTFCPECGTPYFRGPEVGIVGTGTGRSNGKATASLVLGLVGLLLFGIILGILAIIFASIAKREINESPRGTFRNGGSATAGLVLGIVDLVFGFFFFVWILGL